jgi:hypothetical protein
MPDPLQPVLGGDAPFDATADEIETRAELDVHLAKNTLAACDWTATRPTSPGWTCATPCSWAATWPVPRWSPI